MTETRTRVAGWLITAVGSALAIVLVADVTRASDPAYWVIETYPIGLSLVLVGTGVLLARGRLIADRYLGRLLAWTAIGTVVLSLLTAYLYSLAVMIVGHQPLEVPVGALTISTFGALVGLLVGTYDARALERKRVIKRLNQVNSTLRVATGELVQSSARDALEQRICDRLVESEAYEGAFIGEYDPDGQFSPVAWAGLEEASVEALAPVGEETPAKRVYDRAVGTQQAQFLSANPGGESDTGWWYVDSFEGGDSASMAVVPVTEADQVYGLLGIVAPEPEAFGKIEREVFTELGETIGHAIGSIRTHEQLERRERELVAHNERLDKFASVVSHDLRNPLNVILGRVELARERDDGEHLEAIERAGHRMEDIIGDLLSLSRAGKTVDESESVALAAVARDSWGSVSTEENELDLRVPEEATVEADRVRLMAVFENLFRNAIEHNERPVTITVGVMEPATADGDGGSFTGFFVEDDGGGIPAGDRDSVFDHGYTTNTNGTGFGLSIVQEIVQAHGWSISVGEGARGGARFEVRMGAPSTCS